MLTLSAPPDFKKGIGSRVEVGGDLGVSSVASGSGSAPASGSESPPARREGHLPRRESLWLGESEKLS